MDTKVLPAILVVDDQLHEGASKMIFCKKCGAVEQGASAGQDTAVACATFCSGQRASETEIVNDYEVVRQAVIAETPDGSNWALVLMDGQFDSGMIGQHGFPQGNFDDGQFGLHVKGRLNEDFPGLPVVMISNSRHAHPHFPKKELTRVKLIECLLAYGVLTQEQREFLDAKQ